MADLSLLIGELASELHLNPKTVRYYESIGLLPTPERTPGGYRHYGDRDRVRLRFIGKAKAVGLTLGEIRDIFRVRDRGERPCQHVRALLDTKLIEVDRQLQNLAQFRDELLLMRADARDDCGGEVCGIIEGHHPGS